MTRFVVRFVVVSALLSGSVPALAEGGFRYNFDSFAPALAVEVDGALRFGAVFYDGPAADAPATPVDPNAPTADDCVAALSYFSGNALFADASGVRSAGPVASCAFVPSPLGVRIVAFVDGIEAAPPDASWVGVADLGADGPFFDAYGALQPGRSEAFLRAFEVPTDAAGPATVTFLAGGAPMPMSIPASGTTISYAASTPTVVLLWFRAADGSDVWWLSDSMATRPFFTRTP